MRSSSGPSRHLGRAFHLVLRLLGVMSAAFDVLIHALGPKEGAGQSVR